MASDPPSCRLLGGDLRRYAPTLPAQQATGKTEFTERTIHNSCPITVKKALSKVEGVSQVDVIFEKREAMVIFDDAKTSASALTQATENAGYPSTVVGAAK